MKFTFGKVFALTLLTAMFSFGFTSNEGYKVGDKAMDFKLKSVSGKQISLAGLKDAKGAIVIFTCNHCPFSVAYEDRIIALHNQYASKGYPVIAINPNDSVRVPDDSFSNMAVRAKEKAFPFEYVQDATQEIAKAYGASRTPHVFILEKKDKDFFVAYIGGIDNNTDEPENVTQKYVEDAMGEILSGKPVTRNFTKAIGCSIKWKPM